MADTPKDRAALIRLMADTFGGESGTLGDHGAVLRCKQLLDVIEDAGCEVVPIEPTPGMCRAGKRADHACLPFTVYRAMLDVSPYQRKP